MLNSPALVTCCGADKYKIDCRVKPDNDKLVLKSARHFSADFKCSLKLSTAGNFSFRGRLISPRERAVNREFLKKTRIKISGDILAA